MYGRSRFASPASLGRGVREVRDPPVALRRQQLRVDLAVVKFLKVVTTPEYHPVLVHCKRGADRTGTMVAIYRIYAQDWTMDEALQELSRFGFHAIWKNLKSYLKALDVAGLRRQVDDADAPRVDVVK